MLYRLDRILSFAAASFLVASCQPGMPAPADGPDIAPRSRPSMQGVITEVLGPRIKIESDLAGPGGSRDAVVMLAPNATIMRRSGETLRLQDLDLDMRVSLWFTSPGDVKNGRLHATATTVVVEP